MSQAPASALPHLRGMTVDALVQRWPDMPRPVARRLLHRTVGNYLDDLSALRGLSRRLHERVLQGSRVERLSIIDRRLSALDPFAKYLFQAADGSRFEAVRIPLERPRYSVCVSTQAGCALGCAYCATGRLGLSRNLAAWEIVEQVLAVRADSRDRPVTGVVFQGQGEPFLNYDAVLTAAAILRDPSGGRIGADRISISTAGVLPMIERFTRERHPFRLILSLSAASDDKRARIIPLARRYGAADLIAAMRRLAEQQGGPIHLAWVLVSGLNTAAADAEQLSRCLQGFPARVSLIDVNDASGQLHPPDEKERQAFMSALAERGIAFVRRYSGGSDIAASCGLLASTAHGGLSLPAG
jgi:23S rRNA (adenine2503-C2)-methyltransferase